MGIKGSSATARYGDGANASIQVEIADLGSLSGLAGLAAKQGAFSGEIKGRSSGSRPADALP